MRSLCSGSGACIGNSGESLASRGVFWCVSTFSTPGAAAAASESMLAMRPLAIVLDTIAAKVSPGSEVSAV